MKTRFTPESFSLQEKLQKPQQMLSSQSFLTLKFLSACAFAFSKTSAMDRPFFPIFSSLNSSNSDASDSSSSSPSLLFPPAQFPRENQTPQRPKQNVRSPSPLLSSESSSSSLTSGWSSIRKSESSELSSKSKSRIDACVSTGLTRRFFGSRSTATETGIRGAPARVLRGPKPNITSTHASSFSVAETAHSSGATAVLCRAARLLRRRGRFRFYFIFLRRKSDVRGSLPT